MSEKPNFLVVEGRLNIEPYECCFVDDETLPELILQAFDPVIGKYGFGKMRITIERLKDV